MKQILLIMLGLSTSVLADFSKVGDVITDSDTQLQWKDDATGSTMIWTAAIDYCEGLNFAGYNDWRLPNLKELISLVDDSKVSPAIDTAFEHTASNYYWSSTTDVGLSDYARHVYFGYGDQSNSSKSYSYYYVRCVRAGQ